MRLPMSLGPQSTEQMKGAGLTRRMLLATTIFALPTFALAKGVSREMYRDPTAPTAARVRDLLARMTLEEKAAQLRCIWGEKSKLLDPAGGFSAEKAVAELADGIGQIARPSDRMGATNWLAEPLRSIEDTVAFVNAVQRFLVEKTRLGIPALFHEETAHGYAAKDATVFPVPPALGSTWDPELVEQVFAVTGRETRLRGATISLSPVVDLAREPRWGRVEEFFGEDPFLVAQMGIASVRGQQGRTRPLARDKVFVTLKHFVHGNPAGGTNLAPADISERTLRETYLVPFEQIIREADPAAIMPSYNEVEGVPAHANRELLIQTGRERLGFKGTYLSDYDGVTNLRSQHHIAADDAEAAALALHAGVDADLPGGVAFKNLPNLVRTGRIPEATLDAAVSRILTLKFEAGLFENPYADGRRAMRETNTPADVRLARTAAEKAIVLLKNDGVLPLAPDAALKLAVIGPNALEPLFGGYSGENVKAVGVLAGIKAAVGGAVTIEYAEGVRIIEPPHEGQRLPIVSRVKPADPTKNRTLIAQAVDVARRADVVLLVVGDKPEITREGLLEVAPGDRSTLGLFGDQDELVEAMIATGKPIVAVLINGRPLAVTRLAEKANALLECWYLGQEGGNALADVLFGKVNPGGKLAVSFPRSVGELPIYYNRRPSADLTTYVEGKRRALFPFGHGLSYTTFEISEPRLVSKQIAVGETAFVDVDVRNAGSRPGDEVIQLYIRDDVSSVPRPILELRGFKRVTLKPGEARSIRFELTPDALALWDIDMQWRVEPGTFTVAAGPSSAVLKSITLTVV